MQNNTLSFNIEPTFRCNLGCEMCPRFSSEDPHLDMSMDTYERIHESMAFAHTVDFTGWGEPMLHRDIYTMIRAAKEQGCFITMTSNGTVLNRRNSLSLISAGMDRLTISVDGMTTATFDTIRLGASFEQITKNLKEFSQLVDETGSSLELGVAFTIQHANAAELPLIVPWMTSVSAECPFQFRGLGAELLETRPRLQGSTARAHGTTGATDRRGDGSGPRSRNHSSTPL